MGIITISVDDEVERKFRNRAGAVHGKKKGYLGEALTDSMRMWIEKQEQKELAQKASKLMEKGFEMGKILYRHRSELYDKNQA